MQIKRVIAGAWTAVALLATTTPLAADTVALVRPAVSARGAVDAVAAALRGGDPARAERLANLALDRSDLNANERTHVLLNRGLARERLGKRRLALADFTEALRKTSLAPRQRARALFDRGIVHDELGEPDKAIADYTSALALAPDFPAALNNRANAYRRLGRLADARRDYEASLAAGNTEPQYSDYGLGQIAEAQGNPLAAQHYYRNALAADPGYGLAQARLAALKKTLQDASFVRAPSAPSTMNVPVHRARRQSGPVRRANYEAADIVPALRSAILGHAGTSRARIQLGAYRREGDAAAGWNRVVVRAKGLLRGLTPEIVSVVLPGRGRFWRLRAGPLDRHGAGALCAKLKVRGLACLPVKS
jgi:tetratricopeptide (TPR) repeat protein